MSDYYTQQLDILRSIEEHLKDIGFNVKRLADQSAREVITHTSVDDANTVDIAQAIQAALESSGARVFAVNKDELTSSGPEVAMALDMDGNEFRSGNYVRLAGEDIRDDKRDLVCMVDHITEPSTLESAIMELDDGELVVHIVDGEALGRVKASDVRLEKVR